VSSSKNIRRKSLLVGTLVLAWGVLLAGWSMSSPVGSSPDEDFHLASIYCAKNFRPGLCEQSGYPNAKRVPISVLNAGSCFVPDQYVSANCQRQSKVLSNFDLLDTLRLDYESQDIIYYSVASHLTSHNIESSVLKIRFLNVTLLLMLLILFGTVSTIKQFVQLNLVFLIAMMPLGIFIMTSINPQAWQLIGLIFFLAFTNLALHREINRFKRYISIFLAVLAATIAISARSDALFFILLYFIIALLVNRDYLNSRRLTGALGLATVVLLFFWRFNIYRPTNFVSEGFGDTRTGIPFWELMFRNISDLSQLIFGVFGLSDRPTEGYIIGGLGSLDTPMPHVASLSVTVLFVGLIGWAFLNSNRAERCLMLIVTAIYCAIPIYVLQKGNILVGSYLQPRYLLPVTVLLVMLAVPRIEIKDDRSKNALLLAICFLMFAHSMFLHALLRRYTVGNSVSGFSLVSNNAWWWTFNLPSPYFVLLFSSLGLVIVCSACLLILLNTYDKGLFDQDKSCLQT
jgi:hypothetical protein